MNATASMLSKRGGLYVNKNIGLDSGKAERALNRYLECSFEMILFIAMN